MEAISIMGHVLIYALIQLLKIPPLIRVINAKAHATSVIIILTANLASNLLSS